MYTMHESLLKILIVDDERPIRRYLRESLGSQYGIVEADDGSRAIEMAAFHHPDIIVLDLGLPDMDGNDVTRRLREWTGVPIIVISVRDGEEDKVAALDAGADDYLTKPFGVPELMARLRVALRHAAQKPEDASPLYENAGLKVDLVVRKVWLKKKEIRLSPLQYDLLAVLVRNAGRVVSQKQLVKEVWGEAVSPELVRITVHQLRHKIEPDPVRPRSLKTEPGVGYRLED